jgi:hypothetical protein
MLQVHLEVTILYIKANMVSFCLAGQGQGGQGMGRGRQGGQTFSVMLKITDFWPRLGFGNFDLLLLLATAVARILDEISP